MAFEFDEDDLKNPNWENNDELKALNAKVADLDTKLSTIIHLLEKIAANQ